MRVLAVFMMASVLVPLSAFLAPRQAHAVIDRMGVTCVPVDDANRQIVNYDAGIGVFNSSSTTSARVICELSPEGLVFGNVVPQVFVFDRHPSIDFACTFRFSDEDGNAVGGEIQRTSSGSGNFRQTLSGVFNSSAGTSIVTAECTLPPLNSTNGISSLFFTEIHP